MKFRSHRHEAPRCAWDRMQGRARGAALLLLSLTLGACNTYAQLLAPHAQPGGTVTVVIDGGPPLVSKGIVTAKDEPLTINATNTLLTLGIVAADAVGGKTALQLLTGPGTSAVVQIVGQGTSAAQIHAGGRSCVGQSGQLEVALDTNGDLEGTLYLSGQDLQGNACQAQVTLAKIPLDRAAEY